MTPALDLDRATFLDHADGERPAVVRVVADVASETTPLAAYAALTGRDGGGEEPSEYAFLLESAEKTASSDPDGAFRPNAASPDRHARFSYVGYDPEAVITVGPEGTEVEALNEDAPVGILGDGEGDVVDSLRATLPDVRRANFPAGDDRQHLEGGLVGFLAYDAVYDLWLSEVGKERPDSRFPDAQFVLTTRTLAFDERAGTVSLVFTPILIPESDPESVYDDLEREAERVAGVLADAAEPETGGFARSGERAGPREAYEESVRRAKEHVLDGDIYQGVISRTRELYGDVDTLGFYRALREVNPSPYMYLLEHDDLAVVGASPETLVSVRGETVVSNPIAGTCDRGASPVEDRRLAGEMLADAKERAEHTMLVDLARNDVRRVGEAGSVRVEEFMNVLKYSHVQHIESTVTGTLAADADAFDATRAAFPAGTLSGAPKVRAMEIIDDLESEPRGLYGGGVGYYSWTGDADFAIVIRTATVERGAVAGPEGESEDRITVRAGAGLVADSDPEAEYEETEQKMGGTLAAIERIEDGEGGSETEFEPAGSDRETEAEPEVGR
ncbi:anthranilate synthase component I [Saliphagus infecundisoli]|uniref:Anthranilate synthase component 1 n=1 Tax=Saliphagus infecundisoli TaxID=1849069 RepID=A0ABD5QF32_9EURY|nr:anthranilate synthase component I [Saliphagus infecundisoli]